MGTELLLRRLRFTRVACTSSLLFWIIQVLFFGLLVPPLPASQRIVSGYPAVCHVTCVCNCPASDNNTTSKLLADQSAQVSIDGNGETWQNEHNQGSNPWMSTSDKTKSLNEGNSQPGENQSGSSSGLTGNHGHSGSGSSEPSPVGKNAAKNVAMKGDIPICMEHDCVLAASRILENIDPTIDPCDNFFEYACGRWKKINVIPDDKSHYNTFSQLRDHLQVILKGLLEKPVQAGEMVSTEKAKYFYQSCLNESLIEKRGIAPIYSLIDDLGGWPVLEDTPWNESSFDLIDLMAKLRLYNNKILVEQWVSADDKNSAVNIIQLDQPELGMPSREYYLRGADDPIIQVYESFARNVAVALGANEDVAAKDIHDVVELEVKLANITIPQDQRRDSEALYNKMTIRELSENITGFNWLRYLNLCFNKVNINITLNEEIVCYAPRYMQDMVKIVEGTSNRTLANYLIWRIMMNRVINLPEKYRELRKEYKKVIHGSLSERPRWRECVSFINDNMGNAVGRLFIEDHFDEDAKHNALEMIHHIREAFYNVLDDVQWMDPETRKVAKDKAKSIIEKIGYPESILNSTGLDSEYDDVNFYPDQYFENILANIKSIATTNLEKLDEKVDRTKWSTAPAVVNAFYSSTKNQIMFPAGILQPPFYSQGYPKSMNFGGIGMVIGHEITHGFDDRGRQFDKDGNLKQWWDDHVIAKFKQHAQCMVDQYSNFTMPEINMNLNGVLTQGENIADNGGLKEAFKAYKTWAASFNDGEEDARLPGLEYISHDQLFFVNFAQVWCSKIRPEAAKNRILTGVHSPGRFRVIGTLQNSYDFSKVYNCSVNSYMNPVKKCSVW